MEKLQFDTFYKFMVSIGIILIITLIFSLYHFIVGFNDFIISQDLHINLTETSQFLLENQEYWLRLSINIFPWIFVILIIIGIICIIFGALKWYLTQKDLDEVVKIDLLERKVKLGNITASEKAEKIVSETLIKEEEIEIVETEEYPNENKNYILNFQENSQAEKLRNAFKFESEYLSYIRNNLGRKYLYKTDIKINNTNWDMIAISKNNNIDFLYELKYWPQGASKNIISRALIKVDNYGKEYEKSIFRNFRINFIIATSEEKKLSLKKIADEILVEKNITMIEVIVVDEKEFLKED